MPQEPQQWDLPIVSPWSPLPPLTIPSQAVRWYGDAVVRKMVSWFWHSVQGSSFPLIWVSHFQLYIDYMFSLGCPGPIHLGKWIDGSVVSHFTLRGFGFKQRTKWWTKVFKETLRHQKICLTMEYGKPRSQCILLHTGIIALPWDPSRLDHVDRWLYACSGTTFKRHSKALDAIPVAVRNDSFPLVPFTSVA